jgi:hypothetical protein
VAEVVEHLPGNREALSLPSSTVKKEKRTGVSVSERTWGGRLLQEEETALQGHRARESKVTSKN